MNKLPAVMTLSVSTPFRIFIMYTATANIYTLSLHDALPISFDVIICDLRMPHLSGREMYTKLARQDPRVAERIIFATGDTVRGDTLQFLEALGRPYLHKPFTLAELRAALGHAAKQPA